MSEITKPIALDESLHTTEPTPRNLADVLSDELQNLATAISGGSDKVPKTDIATVEPTNTASRAYSVGELVYVNGNLYKVIIAITIGATFTVGTNIQSTNVSGTVKDALDSSANSVSALNTKLTPKCLYDGNVTFTNGKGWIAIDSLSNTRCMLAYAQCVGAASPCVVSLDNAGAGVFVLLPISLGYSGELQVRIYGIGWD